MLFTALILISVEGEHDRLEERVNLCQADQPTECCDVTWL